MPLNQQPNTSRVLQATVSQVSRYISRTTPDNLFQVSAGPPPHMQEDAWHWLTALCGRVYKGFTTFRIMPWPFGTQEEAQAPIAHHYMFPEAISVRPIQCKDSVCRMLTSAQNPSEPGPSTNTLASSSERRAVSTFLSSPSTQQQINIYIAGT